MLRSEILNENVVYIEHTHYTNSAGIARRGCGVQTPMKSFTLYVDIYMRSKIPKEDLHIL